MAAASRSGSTLWTLVPLLAGAIALVALAGGKAIDSVPLAALLWPVLEFAALGLAVFAAVHHADVVAHRTGEPYGTLVLTAAVTVIEVALILAIMFSSDGNATLARDTVLAVIMLVCNGIVGLCLIVGGLRYGEQGFRVPGARAYLIVLMPMATITLILPNFTVSAAGPFYSTIQLVFVSIVTLLLYAVFLYVQTIRHRDYFLSDSGEGAADGVAQVPDDATVARSVVLLLVSLAAVVLLAKEFAGSIQGAILAAGAPAAILGVIVAALVLLPEGIAAMRSARRNELQKSINLALGSSLATIGLTIPAVGVLSIMLGKPLALGVEAREMVLIVLTFAVSLLTFGGGRTNILPGFVHLVLFGTYIAVLFAP